MQLYHTYYARLIEEDNDFKRENMKQKSLGVNAILNGIKQCCSILFPLITFPYVSRILGNDGYGKYSFSFSITNYFILFATLGTYTYAVREGAKIRNAQDKINKFCSQVFSINVCSATISLLLLVCLVFISPKLGDYKAYIFIQSTAIIMTLLGTDWINGIYEDYFYITVRYIIIQLFCLVAMFAFVKTSNDIIPYCIITVLATNGGNFINIIYVKRYVKIKFTFCMNLREHLIPLLILFANSIAISIYVNSDITILGFFENDAQVGIYSFSSKIYNLLKQLINAIIVVSVPRMAFIIKNKSEEYQLYMNKIFTVLNIILLPITIGMFLMSDSIILLAGGNQYISGNIVLKILSVSTLFAIYASLFTNCVLIVNQKEKKCLQATICSSIVNVVFNFLFIPHIGMIGAAITTCIAEAINCFMQIKFSKHYFHWKMIDFHSSWSCVIGSIFVAIICVACNFIFKTSLSKMISAVIISIITYGLVLLVMKNPYVKERL